MVRLLRLNGFPYLRPVGEGHAEQVTTSRATRSSASELAAIARLPGDPSLPGLDIIARLTEDVAGKVVLSTPAGDGESKKYAPEFRDEASRTVHGRALRRRVPDPARVGAARPRPLPPGSRRRPAALTTFIPALFAK
jgi:hypothetical protein